MSSTGGIKKFKMSNVVTVSGTGKAIASNTIKAGQWKTVSSTAVKAVVSGEH